VCASISPGRNRRVRKIDHLRPPPGSPPDRLLLFSMRPSAHEDELILPSAIRLPRRFSVPRANHRQWRRALHPALPERNTPRSSPAHCKRATEFASSSITPRSPARLCPNPAALCKAGAPGSIESARYKKRCCLVFGFVRGGTTGSDSQRVGYAAVLSVYWVQQLVGKTPDPRQIFRPSRLKFLAGLIRPPSQPGAFHENRAIACFKLRIHFSASQWVSQALDRACQEGAPSWPLEARGKLLSTSVTGVGLCMAHGH